MAACIASWFGRSLRPPVTNEQARLRSLPGADNSTFGWIDVVLAHEVPELARATLKMLVDITNAARGKKQSSIIPFAIYTSENI